MGLKTNGTSFLHGTRSLHHNTEIKTWRHVIWHMIAEWLVLLFIAGLKTKTEEHDNEPLDLSFCKNPGFISYLATNFLFSLGYYISSGLLPDTALSNGVDLDDISLTFTVSGIVQIFGRFSLGILSYRYPHYLTKICSFYMIGMGLSMIIVPYSTTFYHYLAFNMISGFFQGKYWLIYWFYTTSNNILC